MHDTGQLFHKKQDATLIFRILIPQILVYCWYLQWEIALLPPTLNDTSRSEITARDAIGATPSYAPDFQAIQYRKAFA